MDERKRRVQWPKWPDEEPAEDLRAHFAGSYDPRVARMRVAAVAPTKVS